MKTKTLTLSISIFATSLVGLTACSNNQDSEQSAAQQMPPPTVQIMPVKFQNIPQYKTLSGRTVAYETSEVRPQATGIIEQILFKEGQYVKKGQALYKINPDNYTNAVASSQAAIEQANANLSTSQAAKASAQASLISQQAVLEQALVDLQRYEDLYKQEAVSKQLVEQARTQVKTARAGVHSAEAAIGQANAGIQTASANISSARANLASNELNANRTIVRAPISGITGISDFTVGTLVNASQANSLVTITKINPIHVDISQSSSEMLKLRQDIASGKAKVGINSVELILEDGSTYNVPGRVNMQNPTVDEATGSTTLRATFANDQNVLLPGMYVSARMAQAVIPNATLLPQSAIMRTPKGDAQVYVVNEESIIEVRKVTIDGTYQGQWIITNGLKEGENVVAIGGGQMIMQVKPGVTVNAQPMPSAQDANATTQQTDQSTQQINSNSTKVETSKVEANANNTEQKPTTEQK